MANAVEGRVVWSPVKSMWINFCLVAFVCGALFATTWSAIILFVFTTYLTLLFGHSIGAHRKLIHRTYECSKGLERLLVYLGVLVGMAGPFGLMKVHDLRDWAQREPACHDFFSHKQPFLVDALWQLNCRFEFSVPPDFSIEKEIADDTFYKFLEKTWILQQLPIALIFYFFGGWPWVVWGVFARVFVSVFGHWTVTYITHNPGPGQWQVPSAGVQASNIPGVGFITMGECWHNNHHAFPESAQIGIGPGESDPGWVVLRQLERWGLVWNLGIPRPEGEREDLKRAA